MPAPNKKLDFVIITALPEEFSAVCDMMDRRSEIYSPTYDSPYRHTFCHIYDKSVNCFGMVAQAQAMGLVDAAILLACILHEWQVRLIGVIGIGGGIPRGGRNQKGAELAEVVFAETIVDVENRKIIP